MLPCQPFRSFVEYDEKSRRVRFRNRAKRSQRRNRTLLDQRRELFMKSVNKSNSCQLIISSSID
jgi:hypothetical protein